MLRSATSALRRSQIPAAARMFSPSATSQHGKSDEFIANEQADKMLPITEVAAGLGIPNDVLEPYGRFKAKLPLNYVNGLDGDNGKLVVVTALTPTKAGEGKTCTSVGLADGLCKIGKNGMASLREPSLGPVFGMKGGAAGGGYAQVVPMQDINLHFTGDLHAIGCAHNLLSAMVDNHLYWGNEPLMDSRQVKWGRVVDMNDRALRNVVVGMGNITDGFPRQDRFDITVASEVMAIFCLATDMADLQKRLGNIIVGYTRGGKQAITARDLGADGAMTALLRDAMQPNLVQTLEQNPAIIHGGPFANIAHGCSSVVSTKAALKLADYVVTEGGFGADLGAEKFFDIKCRKAGLKPDCTVVVATVRALKLHGGADEKGINAAPESVEQVKAGMCNLLRHVDNCRKYKVPVVVAINAFHNDTEAELDAVKRGCEAHGVQAVLSNHWRDGGDGATELAEAVVDTIDSEESHFEPLYGDELPLVDKVRKIAQEIYHADDIEVAPAAATMFRKIERLGFGNVPVCMAKTQYSFSNSANVKGAPSGHKIPISEVRLSAGAEFCVVLTGSIMTMPGLPKKPAAESVGVNEDGDIFGLF